jgi:uncharacterized protein YoxC
LGALNREFSNAPVTLVLAVFAILFAIIQFSDSLALKRRMRRVLSNEETLLGKVDGVVTAENQLLDRANVLVKAIEGVARSLSSRFIGTFPKNMKDIVAVVQQADRYALILTDWVGYAMYSNPLEFEGYRRTLNDLRTRPRGGVPVLMAAFNEEGLRKHFGDQFRREDFPLEKEKDRFKTFFDRYHPGRKPPETYEEFLSDLLRIEFELRADLRDVGVAIQELGDRSLILLWMEDGEDAVFCFQTHGGNERGLSFRTREIGLITSLHDIFSARWKGDVPDLPHVQASRSIELRSDETNGTTA